MNNQIPMNFRLGIFLIILSFAVADQFIASLLAGVFYDSSLLWPIRMILVFAVFALHAEELFIKKRIESQKIVLAVMFVSMLCIGSYLSGANLNQLIRDILTHTYYLSVILYIFWVFNSGNQAELMKFVLQSFVFFGMLSSSGYLLAEWDSQYNPAGTYLNVINFPAYASLSFLILISKKSLLFHLLSFLVFLISCLASDRSLTLALIAVYIIVNRFDLSFLRFFSTQSLIIIAFFVSLFIGWMEIGQSITTSWSTGRGLIWLSMWESLLSVGLKGMFLGASGVDLEMLNAQLEVLIGQSVFNNVGLSPYQAHSVVLKTFWDYGAFGVVIILLIYRYPFNLGVASSRPAIAIFVGCLIIASLNSSTNLIKMDLLGLLLFFGVAWGRSLARAR